jgi:site-specific recombinase XerC
MELQDKLLKEPYNQIRNPKFPPKNQNLAKTMDENKLQELTDLLSKDMKQIREEEEQKWIDSLKNADFKVQELNVISPKTKIRIFHRMKIEI